MTAYGEEHDTYEVPLVDKRMFGAGIKRKRVQFVCSTSLPAKLPEANNNNVQQATQSPGERYLSIVQNRSQDPDRSASPSGHVQPQRRIPTPDKVAAGALCSVCRLPITQATTRPHASTIAHQVCLPHSHAPSSLDRARKGFAILSSYGWDPDQRRGLGARGAEGRLYPVKAREKKDTHGLGMNEDNGRMRTRREEKVRKLGAGEIRKLYEKDGKKRARLQRMFYANDDVDRYLGAEG